MQTHSDDVRVFSPDEPLHLNLHELQERIGARAGDDSGACCAAHVDDGAAFRGAEQAEEGLRHEEGTFDVDFLTHEMIVLGMLGTCGDVREAAYEVVPKVVWVDVFDRKNGLAGTGVIDQYIHATELDLNASV